MTSQASPNEEKDVIYQHLLKPNVVARLNDSEFLVRTLNLLHSIMPEKSPAGRLTFYLLGIYETTAKNYKKHLLRIGKELSLSDDDISKNCKSIDKINENTDIKQFAKSTAAFLIFKHHTLLDLISAKLYSTKIVFDMYYLRNNLCKEYLEEFDKLLNDYLYRFQ